MRALIRGVMSALTCLAAILICAAAVSAANVVVTKIGGQALEGELVSETPTTVTLRIAGIETPISREDIEHVEYKKTPLEEYAERKGALPQDDYDGRYDLAYDMFQKDAYDLALQELESLERDRPNDERVQRLITVIEQKQKLREESAAAGSTSPQPRPTDTTRPTDDEDKEKRTQSELLTDEQVNLVKLWELPADLTEVKPRVVISRETIDKLFTDYATNEAVPKGRDAQRRFRALKPYEQLQLIFDVRARPLYKDIVVRDDPPTLATFRRTINPVYVARYFRQHFGGEDAPGPRLFGNRPNQINEAYTNFYILSTSQHNGLPFIDRAVPERSLLLQWGLPREYATHPAPDVEGWRRYFTGTDDPNFRQFVAWVDQLYDPTPDYGVDYPLPGSGEPEPEPKSEQAPKDSAAQ